MTRYEYRVVPAPARSEKYKGVKGTEARFARTLTDLMNALGRDGWDYVRCDSLPCEERVGLTGRTTKFQNMLVFRRVLAEAEAARPAIAAAPVAAREATPAPAPVSAAADRPFPPLRSDASAAERIAATLTARTAPTLEDEEEGPPRPAPVSAVPPTGAAPRLGGLFRNRGGDVAAE